MSTRKRTALSASSQPKKTRQSAEKSKRWNRVKKLLENKTPKELIDAIDGLYRLSVENAEYVDALFLPTDDGALLEEHLQRIRATFPDGYEFWKKPIPKLGEMKKYIRNYLKGTNDRLGALELTVTFYERAIGLQSEMGGHAPYEAPLLNGLDDLVEFFNVDNSAHFERYRERLLKIGDLAANCGYPFASGVWLAIQDIFAEFGWQVDRLFNAKEWRSYWSEPKKI